MPQEVCFANTMTGAMLFIVGAAGAGGGAQWTNQPPASIGTRPNHPAPYRAGVVLPAGGSLSISYKRTNVPQAPHVNITIQNNGGAIQVNIDPTHTFLLDATVAQSGPPGNEQIILNFRGQES